MILMVTTTYVSNCHAMSSSFADHDSNGKMESRCQYILVVLSLQTLDCLSHLKEGGLQKRAVVLGNLTHGS